MMLINNLLMALSLKHPRVEIMTCEFLGMLWKPTENTKAAQIFFWGAGGGGRFPSLDGSPGALPHVSPSPSPAPVSAIDAP